MAVTIESVSTVTFSSTTNVTVPKPTGLAAGELMVAHIGGFVNTPDEFATPAGWTQLVESSDDSDDYGHAVFYKTADSSDAAASDFTFNGTNSGSKAGAIFRISGAASLQQATDTTAEASASPSYANTVTPSQANSLLLLLLIADSGCSASNYAIATSNPSWTERYDLNDGGADGTGKMLAAASATRPETTGTGNSSASLSANIRSKGTLVVVAPVINATATVSAATLTAAVNDPARLQIVNPAALSIEAPTVTANPQDPAWANTPKTSTTWTNESKS